MEDHKLPRNRECGCYSDWSYDYLCSVSMRLGDWQWKRQSGGELITFCLRGFMHLPDLHRLSTSRNCRGTTSFNTARFPTTPSDIHGFVFNTFTHLKHLTLGRSFGLYLLLGRIPDHYTINNNFVGLSHFRILRCDSNHSCHKGIGSSRSISGA